MRTPWILKAASTIAFILLAGANNGAVLLSAAMVLCPKHSYSNSYKRGRFNLSLSLKASTIGKDDDGDDADQQAPLIVIDPTPSTSTPSSFSTQLSELRNQLLSQTITRIAIPSLSASLLTYMTFPFATRSIYTFVQTSFNGIETGRGYEALNLILTDNSNQFIQNAHNFLALNFCFLTSFTFAFLYNNQVSLYYALFEEVTEIISLMEQVALCTEGRSGVYMVLLDSIKRYVEEDLKFVTKMGGSISITNNTMNNNNNNKNNKRIEEDLPAILVSQRPQNDPLETILYLTSVGRPSNIYSTIKSLRQARAKRLASLQRKLPEVNMYLLYILGFTTWVTFPIVTAGSSTVGGESLIEVYRNQLSIGVLGMGCVLGILNELKQPEVGSAYNVDYSILGTLMDGLENELDCRMGRCMSSCASNVNGGGDIVVDDDDDEDCILDGSSYKYNGFSDGFGVLYPNNRYDANIIDDWSHDSYVDELGMLYSYDNDDDDDDNDNNVDAENNTTSVIVGSTSTTTNITMESNIRMTKNRKKWFGKRIWDRLKDKRLRTKKKKQRRIIKQQ